MNEGITKIQEKINNYNLELKKFQEEVRNELKTNLHTLIKELFDTYPRLKSFGFTAYTPYFNDGEECVYRVYSDYPAINGYDENYGESDESYGEAGENLIELGQDYYYGVVGQVEEESWFGGKRVKTGKMIDKHGRIPKECDKEAAEIVKAVKTTLRAFDDDFWKAVIGDHVRVTIDRNGIKTVHHEHD